MGLGGTLRRLRAEPVVALATVVTVTLALVLLAAGPIYSEALSVAALRRSLVDAPTATTAVDVSILVQPAEIEPVERLANERIERAFGDVDYDSYRSLRSSESFELPDQPNDDRIDLASVVWLESVESEIELTAGTLLTPSDATVPVLVDADAAATLDLAIGRSLTVRPRSGTADPVTVEISGHYRVTDAFGRFWHARDGLVEPLTLGASFRTVTMLTTREAMLGGLSSRPEVGTLAIPRFDQVGLDDVAPLRANLSSLESSLNRQRTLDSPEASSEFDVVTSAPSVLVGRDRTLTVARSVIIAVVVQLAVLAAFALVLVAGLGVDARRSEATTLRARGASATQLLGQALVDASIIVVPIALAAPYLASHLVGLVDRFGPLASSGLVIDPRIGSEPWVVVGFASVATITLLAWPAFRAGRIADASEQRRSRSRIAGGLQRSGIDIAIVTLAVLAYWQLRTLDDARATTVRGWFGVDPLLIAAPTFGLVAGAFVALRVVPVAARIAERAIDRRRSATMALSGWQLARRPHRYTRTALLLIMSVSMGTFATAYEATWTASQAEQAAHEVGAEGRVVPNRRTGDSIAPLQLVSTLAAAPGVGTAMAVVDTDLNLPVSDKPGRLIALDADQPNILTKASAGNENLPLALRELAARRPSLAGLELPGEPVRLELAVDVVPAESPIETDGVDIPLAGSISLLLQDGNGLLHRLNAGQIGVGRVVRSIELLGEGSGTPTYPLSVIDIQFNTATQGPIDRDVAVAIEPLELVDSDGNRSSIPLDETAWTSSTETQGFLSQPANISSTGQAPVGGLGLRIGSGSSLLSVVVIHNVTPSSTVTPFDASPVSIAGVATSSWLETSGAEVGEFIPIPFGRGDDVLVEITGVVPALPTVDPGSTDALLVDLPTLLWIERQPGRTVRRISEYWITVDDASAVVDPLTRPPIEAVEVQLLRDREIELTSNPPALSAIGAMTLGFVAAGVFAVAGFVVTVMVSARERRSEFALLYALGLTERQHRRWMLSEQVILVATSLIIGTLLGLALARLILPVVSLSQDGTGVYPGVIVRYPWRRIALLELALVGGLLLGMAGVRLLQSKRPVASSLRGVGA